MKLFAVLLLCSAALVVAQEVAPAAVGGSCYQSPTCDTPPGTDGWLQCTFTNNGTTLRVCTAVCNEPYFTSNPNDPTTLCTSTGGWAEPVGACTPTLQNCVSTQPPNNGGLIVDWRCNPLVGGDYAEGCLGECTVGYTPLQGENPTAHCNRYTGKWEVTGGCIQESCSATPPFAAPPGTNGWTDCGSVNDVYVCTAPCSPNYRPSPSAPQATCSKDTGDWTGITGSCKPTPQCSLMPPAGSNPRPANSVGWDTYNCQTVGSDYTCVAECKQGFSGQPTASCDTSTGYWSPTSGRCIKDRNPNKCSKMPPPGTPVPPNSYGWTMSGCTLASPMSYQCVADCKQGYFGIPSISCDPRTGYWSSVDGSCRSTPDSGCTATPVSSNGAPLPSPTGSEGWDVSYCFTSSGRYTCQSPCMPGYEPMGSIPYSVCTSAPGSSTFSWSPVRGRCQQMQPACSSTPPYAAPTNTIGWQQQYCREVNGQYTCTAYCATNYKQGSDGLPSASCDIMYGTWTAVGGSCVPDGGGGGGCSSLPSATPPQNTLGWRETACYTTGYGPSATTMCYATCTYGYTGSGANGYDPYATCDWKTGQWSSVNGFCIPEGGGGSCDAGYPNVPEPANSCGWSCSTMGWGPSVQRVCTASCKPGYYGYPCAPSISCSGSGSWTGVKGACMPYEQPSQPCWGYPGGKPTCNGGKAKWSSTCGGSGTCYQSGTYAKNCGSKCNLYCPSSVQHGTRCTAPCSGGTSGSFQSTCVNGKWTTIDGGCKYR